MKTEQECFGYLEKISTPQLSENGKAVCEGKLTLKNIWEALNSMKNGKTPGNDGLTNELYVCFFEEMGSLLLKSLIHSHAVGELSTSHKQAVITLIEKKGRDKRLVKNWRPISLMNVDVKIASKALSFRLKQVLPNLMNPMRGGGGLFGPCHQTVSHNSRTLSSRLPKLSDFSFLLFGHIVAKFQVN